MMKDKINKTMQRLDKAYKILSAILLNEDNVDRMAMAKKELRGVYVELNELATLLKPEGKKAAGGDPVGPEMESADGQTDRG